MTEESTFTPRKNEFEIDPYDNTFVRLMEDPQNGFDLVLGGGRTTIQFGLQEAKKLKRVLTLLMDKVDKKLKEGHKEVSPTGGSVLSGKVAYDKKAPLSLKNMPDEDSRGLYPLDGPPPKEKDDEQA